MSVITAESKVTLHFSLTLENGDVVDSTFDKKPATFSMGDGSLLPGFEQKLIGLAKGDRQTVVVEKKSAFGPINPENVQYFNRKDFAEDMELTKGLVVSFKDASGGELPGVVAGADNEEVMIDFNHPLAGRDITFTVEIIDVE